MNWKKLVAITAACVLLPIRMADAQQGGGVVVFPPITPGHCASWKSLNILQDAGVVGCGGAGGVTSITGTANQITVTGTATPVLSIPSTFIAPGSLEVTTTAKFDGTATFADNGTWSSANGIAASIIAQAGDNARLTSAGGGGVRIGATNTLGWSSTGGSGNTVDAGISRNGAAAAIAMGNGTAADTSAHVSMGDLNVTGSTVPANGVYLSGANTVGISAGTSGRVTISTSGLTVTSGTLLAGTTQANGVLTAALAPAVSQSAFLLSGAAQTGGSSTTNFPQLFIQPTGTTAVTSWSGNGTIFGMNLGSGFAGNLADWRINNGSSLFKVDASGNVTGTGSLIAGGNVQAGSGSQFLFSGRGILTSSGAGTITLGAADVAAPVAQILAVQNVVTGTSNTNGQNFTIFASASTGSGTGGDIIFKTVGTGAAATAQNTYISALTIKGATQAVNAAGAFSTGVGSASGTLNVFTLDGGSSGGSDMTLKQGGTTYAVIGSGNALGFGGSTSTIIQSQAGTLFLCTAGGSTFCASYSATGTLTLAGGVYNSCTALTTNGSGVVGCTVSDIRLKNPLGQIDGAVALLLKIPAAQLFTYKDKARFDAKQHIGLYAQDVCKAIPNACAARNVKGGIEYNYEDRAVISLLVRAVQEQKAANDNLSRRIAAIERSKK